MSVVYRKVPLTVEALFMPDGSVFPESLLLDDAEFQIDKIISSAERTPRTVTSISPTEYTVMVRGRVKKIYYETENNTWFSVKEVYT